MASQEGCMEHGPTRKKLKLRVKLRTNRQEHILQLPEHILAGILSRVELGTRLRNCSRVCRQFHDAAAAACKDLQRPDTLSGCVHLHNRPPIAASFLQWTQQHGHHVTCLKLSNMAQGLTHLPCANLRQLELQHCKVLLSPAWNLPGILQGCHSLQALALKTCQVLDMPDLLPNPSLCPDLQHIELRDVSTVVPAKDWRVLGSLIVAHLSSLTHLSLQGASEQKAIRHHLAKLTRLQHLALDDKQGVVFNPAQSPGFTALGALKTLHLRMCSVKLDMLSVLTRLEDLKLDCVSQQGPEAQLLQEVLPCMRQLRSISIKQGGTNPIVWLQHKDGEAQSPHMLSTLTLSSQLQSLELINCTLLPSSRSAWHYVFPALDQKTGLTSFKALMSGHGDKVPVLDHNDICWIDECCPNLRALAVSASPKQDTMTVLAQLTRIRNLQVKIHTAPASTMWMKPLEAHRQLTRLECSADRLLLPALPKGLKVNVKFDRKVRPEGVNEVWKQLEGVNVFQMIRDVRSQVLALARQEAQHMEAEQQAQQQQQQEGVQQQQEGVQQGA